MIELPFTEEEMCRQLMEELEQLTDEEWAMIESTKGKR
jgi:hypothetical protein